MDDVLAELSGRKNETQEERDQMREMNKLLLPARPYDALRHMQGMFVKEMLGDVVPTPQQQQQSAVVLAQMPNHAMMEAIPMGAADMRVVVPRWW